jgi:hypothetical protein
MAIAPDNQQRLREGGVLKPGDLPPEYVAVVEGLTPDEVDVIVAVRRRLDEAGRVSGVSDGEYWLAP